MRIDAEMKSLLSDIKKVYPKASMTDCAGVWEMWSERKYEGEYSQRIGWSSKSRQECVRQAHQHLGQNPASFNRLATK